MSARAPIPVFFDPTDETTWPADLAAIVAFYRERKAAAPPTTDEHGAREITNDSSSQLSNRRRSREYPSFRDGAKRVYPTGPLYDRLIARAIASYGSDGRPLAVRNPPSQFQPGHKPQAKTPAQMRAFKAANEKRICAAQERKARAAEGVRPKALKKGQKAAAAE